MTIDDIMNKLSRKTLIIIITILSSAIILLLIIGILSRNNPSEPDSSGSTSSQPFQEPTTVVIDPGHGGWEPGAENGKIHEKDITLAISLEIEKVLIEKNIDYYMIRNNDTYYSLEDRVRIANEKSCRLFVSIHNNAFKDASQGGILTIYNPSSSTGKDFAEIMQSKISDIGMQNRNIMPRPDLYVLRYTNMPSLLLEIGFISNKSDLKLLTDTEFQKKCAKQVVLGIEEILSSSPTGEAENSSED